MSQPFAVSVTEQPALALVGMMTRTSMEHSGRDCPALWEAFARRIHEVTGGDPGVFPAHSYGPSFNVDPQTGCFDYWAAVAAPTGAAAPQGMERVTVPAGLYASCVAPSLAALADAYATLFQIWPASQAEYGMDDARPCYERYHTVTYANDGSFELFVPVKKK